MKRRLVLAGLAAILVLVVVGLAAGWTKNESDDVGATSGMPVPGLEGVEESIAIQEGGDGTVSLGVPAPGHEDAEEMIVIDGGPAEGGSDESVVSAGMPVPGYEDVEEMIVIDDGSTDD